MRKTILFLTALLLATSLSAAEAPASNDNVAETPPEYAIELLLFLRTPEPDGETWPQEPERPEPGMAIATVSGETPPEFPPDLRLPAETAPFEQANASGGDATLRQSVAGDSEPFSLSAPAAPSPGPADEPLSLEGMANTEKAGPIQPLPAEYLKLSAQADALRRKGLEPVLHTAWKQVVGDRDNKDWLWLETDSVYGLVRISLGRYLHLDTRLLLLGPPSESEPRQAILTMDHRRMRSGELHHLDHPGFGILIQIDKYEAPAEESEPLMLESLQTSPNVPQQPTIGTQ